jgi:hypothetical protein
MSNMNLANDRYLLGKIEEVAVLRYAHFIYTRVVIDTAYLLLHWLIIVFECFIPYPFSWEVYVYKL